VLATKACLSAFRREGPLQHDGPYYKLSLLTEQWTPSRHDYEDVKVDISAVGPIMNSRGRRGRRRHPCASHALDALHQEPACCRVSRKVPSGAGRDPAKIDKIIPVIVAAGDTPEEAGHRGQGSEDDDRLLRCNAELRLPVRRSRLTTGLRDQLRDCLKTGDTARAARRCSPTRSSTSFAVVARWEDVADRMIERLQGHRGAPGHLPRLTLARGRSKRSSSAGATWARAVRKVGVKISFLDSRAASCRHSPCGNRPRRCSSGTTLRQNCSKHGRG